MTLNRTYVELRLYKKYTYKIYRIPLNRTYVEWSRKAVRMKMYGIFPGSG